MVEGERSEGPPPPPSTDESRGIPRFVRFDGILEGPLGDAAAVRAAVSRLNGVRVVQFELEIDGGRFSLLPDDQPISGEQFGAAQREDFGAALQEVVASSRDPRGIESTLRCVAVYQSDAIETLFASAQGQLKAISRARGLRVEDQQLATSAPSSLLPRVSRQQALGLGGLLILLCAILCWQNGYLDRLLATDAQGLEVVMGPFEDLVEVELEHRWGNYQITLRRGSAYPSTAEAAEALESAAVSTEDRAAVRVVADGADVYVRLEDADGKVLTSQRVELRSLLSSDDGEQELRLPGKMAARRLVVALDEGNDK